MVAIPNAILDQGRRNGRSTQPAKRAGMLEKKKEPARGADFPYHG
jgi:hypothetical protein